ncbi:hypothetical protein FKW77_005564 [Venturia effusa]|uniref:Mid2 domain-containing protein n=1 Tax=Venturia effusa TaxID=50376 RepID=A0A517KWF2_9PEZI|nr:hypothetical protein FKW77_005564 [Venturia effusa]
MSRTHLVLATLLTSTYAACFLPNGTDINRLRLGNVGYDRWLPCATTGGMCCRLNDSSPDTCTSQGLCHNDVAPNLWRESCTDSSWGSTCLQLCVGANAINTGNPNWPNGTPVRDSHTPLTECQDNSLCCGRNNTVCCSQGQGKFIVNGQVTNSKPSSTSSSSSSPTASATSSTAPASSSNSSSNTGAIAGGVVGGVAGLLLILGALWGFLRRRKRAPADTGAIQQSSSQRPPLSEMDSSEPQKHEMASEGLGYRNVGQNVLGGGVSEVHELDGGPSSRYLK